MTISEAKDVARLIGESADACVLKRPEISARGGVIKRGYGVSVMVRGVYLWCWDYSQRFAVLAFISRAS